MSMRHNLDTWLRLHRHSAAEADRTTHLSTSRLSKSHWMYRSSFGNAQASLHNDP
jgi:hypothetical protein